MVENRNEKKVLITPVTAEDLADIHIGDIVYLDGDLVTCRDGFSFVLKADSKRERIVSVIRS